MNCLICSLPLPENDLYASRKWHFECNKCEICGNEGIQDSRIADCLKQDILVSHLGCWLAKMEAEVKNKQVTVTQAHLDYLNQVRLCFMPNESLSLEGNAREAEIFVNRLVNESSSLEYAYQLLTKLQSAAAAVSIILGRNKEKIKLDLRQRDIEKYRDVEKYRTESQEKTETRKKTEREKEEKKIQLQAERENPKLRLIRKAIAGFVAIGFTEEQAREMVMKQENQK